MKSLVGDNRMHKLWLTSLVLLTISGCASIAGEKMQPITFKTIKDSTEVAGVGCAITNDAGSWFVTTPGSVTVHKSTGDLSVDCKKDDLFGHETLVSKSNGAVWANIILGGGIGYIVDRNTGAGFNYPDTSVINLKRISDASSTDIKVNSGGGAPSVENKINSDKKPTLETVGLANPR